MPIEPPSVPLANHAVTVRGSRVGVSGDIDVSCVEDFERALIEAETAHGSIVVDLDGAGLLDSSAINVLFASAVRARDRGEEMTVEVTDPLIRRVLRMMFLDELVEVRPALHAADDRDGPTVLPL